MKLLQFENGIERILFWKMWMLLTFEPYSLERWQYGVNGLMKEFFKD